MSNLQTQKERLLKIKIGKGIRHILDEAYRILGNPIMTHDMDYKVIAHTENPVEDDPIWQEFVTTGMVGHDRQVFYKEECFFELCANAKKITFLLSDKLQYKRIFGKLLTKNNIQIGCACMVECCQPFEDGTPELFELVCDILTKEFSKNEFYQSYGQSYMDSLTGRLIEDTIEDKDLYTAHIESIYTGTKVHLRLAIVDITQGGLTQEKLAFFRDACKRAQPAFKYVLHADYIVIIISTDRPELDVTRDLGRLCRVFKQHNLHVGISGSFENIFELPKRYTEAVDALGYALKDNRSTVLFDKAGAK